nr:Mur ligase family, glutamate ligase domain protein [uncultured bacterium]
MYDQGNDVVAAARQRSDSQGATLHLVDTGLADPARQLDLPLFQKRNFRLAYQAVAYVLERDSRLPLKPSQLEGAATVYIPGRMETLHIAGKTVILDGAHNVQKMTALVTSLRERYPSTPVAAVVAVAEAQDMRWQGALEVLVPEMQYVIATAFEVGQDVPKQSVTPQGVADYVRSFSEVGVEVRPHIVDALQALLARPEPLVLVTGSLYLMGMAKAHLKDLL